MECLPGAVSADELSGEGHGQIQVTLQEGERIVSWGFRSCPLGTARKGFCVNSLSCSVPTGSNSLRVLGAGETAHWLRALAALAEDGSLVQAAHNHLSLQLHELQRGKLY